VNFTKSWRKAAVRINSQKKGKVKVAKLRLNKETVKNLGAGEARKVKGGIDAVGGNELAVKTYPKKC